MLGCHQSQKEFLDRTQGMDSYIQTMKDLNAKCAEQIGGMAYAEGFRRHLYYGYSRREIDPLSDLLGDLAVHREA